MAEFNLNQIFKNAFGYDAPQSFSIDKGESRREFSNLGQRYYQEDMLGREFFLPVTINDLLIPFAVMSMNWTKRILETAMPERNGEVNELISIGGHTFNIKGLLVNEDNEFPENDIVSLYDLFKINASVSMRSALSDIVLSGEFDHKVIIKELKWPGNAGVEHVKAFEIDVKEDTLFELSLD